MTENGILTPQSLRVRPPDERIYHGGPLLSILPVVLAPGVKERSRAIQGITIDYGTVHWTQDHALLWLAILHEAIMQLDAPPSPDGTTGWLQRRQVFLALDTIAFELGWPTDARGLRRIDRLVAELARPTVTMPDGTVTHLLHEYHPGTSWHAKGHAGHRLLGDNRDARVLATWVLIPNAWLHAQLYAVDWQAIAEAPHPAARRIIVATNIRGGGVLDAGDLLTIPSGRPPSWAKAKLDDVHEWLTDRELLIATPEWSGYKIRYQTPIRRPLPTWLPRIVNAAITAIWMRRGSGDRPLTPLDLADARRAARDALDAGAPEDGVAVTILYAGKARVVGSFGAVLRHRFQKLDAQWTAQPNDRKELDDAWFVAEFLNVVDVPRLLSDEAAA